ncbi:MAG TPA: hypothetical protein ENI86_12975 [Acidimicrobiales bacterium]|nr:hypothetical protein [Acidimicrobiales bacterium]
MSAGDLAAVVVTIASVAAVTAFVLMAVRAARAVDDLTEAARLFVEEATPTVRALRETLERADVDLDRLDGLLDTAETVSGTVESASRVTQAAVADPAIRTVAFLSGTRHGLRRLLRRNRGRPEQAPGGG